MTPGISRRTTMKSAVGGAAVLATGGGVLADTAGAAERRRDTSDESLLWYAAPAADWEREALPIGNGAMGAMVYGGLGSEQLQFNEKTLWTGGPGAVSAMTPATGTRRDPVPWMRSSTRSKPMAARPRRRGGKLGETKKGFGAYQTFGDLYLDIRHDDPTRTTDVTSTSRDATAHVTYTHDGVTYDREYFASHPDNVIASRPHRQPAGQAQLTLRYTSPRADYTATATGGRIDRGALADNGMKFEAQVQVEHRRHGDQRRWQAHGDWRRQCLLPVAPAPTTPTTTRLPRGRPVGGGDQGGRRRDRRATTPPCAGGTWPTTRRSSTGWRWTSARSRRPSDRRPAHGLHRRHPSAATGHWRRCSTSMAATC